jgi:hypothetical protein
LQRLVSNPPLDQPSHGHQFCWNQQSVSIGHHMMRRKPEGMFHDPQRFVSSALDTRPFQQSPCLGDHFTERRLGC